MLDIDPDTVTTEDLSSLRYICEVVSRRASFMASFILTGGTRGKRIGLPYYVTDVTS